MSTGFVPNIQAVLDIQGRYFSPLKSYFEQAKVASSSNRGTLSVEFGGNPSDSAKHKFEKLELCLNQLILEKQGTPRHIAKMSEVFNVFTDIVRENWDDFPVSLKDRFRQKSNFLNFDFAKSLIVSIFSFGKLIRLIPLIFSKKPQDIKLLENYSKSVRNIITLYSEIRKYGHPLKFKDDRTKKQKQEQINKNQAAMSYVNSLRSRVLTPEEQELNDINFEIMRRSIDDNRPDEEKVFSEF
jgi:hypothetical protein